MPRDVSLSDSKCWNGGHEWVNDLQASVEGIYRPVNLKRRNLTSRILLREFDIKNLSIKFVSQIFENFPPSKMFPKKKISPQIFFFQFFFHFIPPKLFFFSSFFFNTRIYFFLNFFSPYNWSHRHVDVKLSPRAICRHQFQLPRSCSKKFRLSISPLSLSTKFVLDPPDHFDY